MAPSDSGFDNVVVPVVEEGLNPTVVENPVVDQHENVHLAVADQQPVVSVNYEGSITEVPKVEKEENKPLVASKADLALVHERGDVAGREDVVVPARRVGSIEPFQYMYSRRRNKAAEAAVVPDEKLVEEKGKELVVGGVGKGLLKPTIGETKPWWCLMRSWWLKEKESWLLVVLGKELHLMLKPIVGEAKLLMWLRWCLMRSWWLKEEERWWLVPGGVEKGVTPYAKTYSRRSKAGDVAAVVPTDVSLDKPGLASVLDAGGGQVLVDAELGIEKPTVEAEKVLGTSVGEKAVAALQAGQVSGNDDDFIQEQFVPPGPVDKKGVEKHVQFTRKMNQAAQGPAQEPGS